MNPAALLLIAMMAGSGKQASPAPFFDTFKLDMVLDKLQSTVNTLEKVNQLSQMGGMAQNAFSLPSPQPASREYASDAGSEPEPKATPSPLENIDLQGAMQTLGPIISMLTGSQNQR